MLEGFAASGQFERYGGGHGREQGGVELHSQCGESSAGLHEPQFMCDRLCRTGGFQYFDIASVMVEESGELHTMNFCEGCYNLSKTRGKELMVNGK